MSVHENSVIMKERMSSTKLIQIGKIIRNKRVNTMNRINVGLEIGKSKTARIDDLLPFFFLNWLLNFSLLSTWAKLSYIIRDP